MWREMAAKGLEPPPASCVIVMWLGW